VALAKESGIAEVVDDLFEGGHTIASSKQEECQRPEDLTASLEGEADDSFEAPHKTE
jgi:hypothetical protein